MHNLNKPIILIGFKHVGKTAIGAALAQQLSIQFIDLDQAIEHRYVTNHQTRLSTREILDKQGEGYFRELEHQCLETIIAHSPCVIASGGGTILNHKNHKILKLGTIIHIQADKQTVFDRIMNTGLPSFFPKDMDPYQAFIDIWSEREPLYQHMADETLNNDSTIHDAVERLVATLRHERPR